MIQYEGKTFDQERALYGSRGVELTDCAFDGPADGESALKESQDVRVIRTRCNLRYPFWHDERLTIQNSELTDKCRAAIWYSHHIQISETRLHGIKALRECGDVTMRDCDIVSPEFGWSVTDIEMRNCTAQGEYFMMRSQGLRFSDMHLKGKYSFQYIQDAVFENCEFDTKDAFWHGENILVRDSVIRGEYFAWYSDGLTLENCTILGTQPLCYCKNLRLIQCKMIDADLAFEKSDVEATITTPVVSVKNPRSGHIQAPAVGEIIMDDPEAKGIVKTVKEEIK